MSCTRNPAIYWRGFPTEIPTAFKTPPSRRLTTPFSQAPRIPLSSEIRFKTEQAPAGSVSLEGNRLDRLAGKRRDGAFPEPVCGSVGRHHSNFPASRELPPELVCDFRAGPASPVTADHKKFCHIPTGSAAGDQGQPRQPAFDPDKKRVPVRLGPIQRQTRIAEAAVLAQLDGMKFAEIVRVQFEQVGEDRLLIRRCPDNFNHDFAASPARAASTSAL